MPRTKFDLDLTGLEKTFARLHDEDKLEHMARSVALAGAKVLRDEAKARAPVESGTLRDSIYVAHDDKHSGKLVQTYSVSWNAKKAPHGHLIEFGHWLVRAGKRLVWVAGQSFLRSAYEAKAAEAQRVMKDRADKKIQELANGSADQSGS